MIVSEIERTDESADQSYGEIPLDELRRLRIELQNAMTRTHRQVVAGGSNGKAKLRTKPKTPRNQAKQTEATGERLRIDEAARLTFWNGKRLQINAQADFEVLRKLHSAGGVIASHVDLFRALKPDKIIGSVEALTTAPPEVKEAISHIRKALRTLACPYRIETVKQHGYLLRSPDE